MGKSGKKTKSDRINALRKQYDAFLDEDKKRKDRNEFILGRLEKMRLYTPAVLPVHHNLVSPQIGKYHFVTPEQPEYLRKIRFDDNLIQRSRATDVLPDCVLKDEQKILQEISKKYILIPKLRPTNEYSATYYNPSSGSNDADWRNKYNILDELKKVEKEGSSEVSKDTDAHDTFNNRENTEFESIKATPGKEQKLNSNKDPIYDTQQNGPDEKGPVTELQTNNSKNYPNYNIECKTPLGDEQNIIPNKAKNADLENKVDSPGFNFINQEQHFSDSNKVSNEFYLSGNVVNVKLRNENKNVEKLNNQVQNVQQKGMKVGKMVPMNTDHISTKVNNKKNETFAQNNTVKLSNADIVNSNTKVPFIEKENIDLSLKTVETVAQPVESIENQEHYAITGQNEPISENIPQEYKSNNETAIVSDVIPSQIDEFEAEQKGMFYTEETGYNQNVDTMGYNAQNEEYTNEQYSYYNESQQEQPYYAEINEHEESTERYDPNYEQQYVENYEENVNVAQYENQQYVENQQEVMNINYEQQPDQQEITNGNYYDQHPAQQELTNVNYDQQPGQQDLNIVNYEQQSVQQDLTNINYEQQLGQQDLPNVNYEQELGQQDLTNVNYEQEPGQQDLSNVNYEQQPVNYDYEHSAHLDNSDQSQIQNINTCDGQASELVNYETQQYNEVGEVEQPTIPDQNVYENQPDYVQMHTEQEVIQNMEQQLDGEEGYTEIQNTYPSVVPNTLENTSDIEPNIKVT